MVAPSSPAGHVGGAQTGQESEIFENELAQRRMNTLAAGINLSDNVDDDVRRRPPPALLWRAHMHAPGTIALVPWYAHDVECNCPCRRL